MADELKPEERARIKIDEQLVDAGISPDLVRLSVGIENAEDIIADIAQALEAARG